MPRQPSVRYFSSRNAYYCQFRGKQHLLASGPEDFPNGPTYQAALKAFGQLMATGDIEKDKDENQIQAILEKYMQHAQGRLAASTFQRLLYQLRPFQQDCGALPVSQLTHFRLEEFILKQRRPRQRGKFTDKWSDGTVKSFLDSANAAFNWARKRKLITFNPLEGFEGPSKRSRSRDCLLSPEDHQRILVDCRSKAMKNLIMALENTGARPGELINAKTSDWNDEMGAIVYYGDDRRRKDEFRHKSAAHKDRFIYFTGAALEMVRELVRTRPDGSFLFPSSRGRAYRRGSVQSYFEQMRERLGLPNLTAYSYRHTFATEWLLAGKSIEILAELLGNTPQTIRKHYAHLCGNRLAIRRHLEEFRQAQKPCTSDRQADGPDAAAQPA
ncbi:MAG TPA: tyrosine-type recombinase/integrase [Gemmataceae bacterium]